MKELAFPMLGTLIVFLLVVPAMTLLTRIVLAHQRRATSRLTCLGSGSVWLAFVVPVVAPIVWCISAAIHQSEPGGAVAACLNRHLGSEACQDALAFATGLACFVAYVAFRRTQREMFRRRRAPGRPLRDGVQQMRLVRLCASSPSLGKLRVSVLDQGVTPICTVGLLRPRVEITRRFVDSLDDEELTGALLHEAAHVRSFDPLRLFVLSFCQALNPASSLLHREYLAWRLGREAACDEAAVTEGGDPLAIAQAIVAAARSTHGVAPVNAFGLGSREVENIQLRVQLLLGRSGPGRIPPAQERPLFALAALLAMAAAMPHAFGSGPLDSLHIGIETAVVVFGIF